MRDVLGPGDDITYFAYAKKNNREQGPAVVGIELPSSSDFPKLIERMNQKKIDMNILTTIRIFSDF